MRFSRLGAVTFCVLSSFVAVFPSRADDVGRALNAFTAGIRELQAGRNVDAVAWLTKAISAHALKPEDAARALFDRGVAHDAMRDTQSAIADYSAALAINPAFSAALNNRANAFRRAGKFKDAKRDYLAALNSLEAKRQYSYYGLGLIAGQEGDPDGARLYFQKALAEDSGFSLAAEALAALSHEALPVKLVVVSQPERPPTVERSREAARIGPVLRPTINETGRAMVQLGAFRDEASAVAGWNKVVTASGGALDGLRPVIVSVELPGRGRFWRLRAAVGEVAAAKKLCKRLNELRLSCMQVLS